MSGMSDKFIEIWYNFLCFILSVFLFGLKLYYNCTIYNIIHFCKFANFILFFFSFFCYFIEKTMTLHLKKSVFECKLYII